MLLFPETLPDCALQDVGIESLKVAIKKAVWISNNQIKIWKLKIQSRVWIRDGVFWAKTFGGAFQRAEKAGIKPKSAKITTCDSQVQPKTNAYWPEASSHESWSQSDGACMFGETAKSELCLLTGQRSVCSSSAFATNLSQALGERSAENVDSLNSTNRFANEAMLRFWSERRCWFSSKADQKER